MSVRKPMLACKPTKAIKFPCYASVKLDGIRGLIMSGVALSRTFKPIPNKHIQDTLQSLDLEGLDGELIIGKPWAKDVYTKTVSGVMRSSGEPEFMFYIFDDITMATAPYRKRHQRLELAREIFGKHVQVLNSFLIYSQEDLDAYEEQVLAEGFEGVILRNPDAPYKFGRGSPVQQQLLKIKKFEDSEATLLGFEERMHNENVATKDAFGRTERSSHQDNKYPAGDLGAMVVKDLETGIEFNIGTGFSAAQRKEFWDNKANLLDKIVKYKFFPVGVKEKPRHPVFLGFRDKIDIGSPE